ncbi:MAG: (deoxy)nucleoside triphosphate pyrophosphohydrolase [Longicatena sp.]|nr:(deoxy)nucleoside triphosphate pyrophosphohydrolase [Longicatena sp.]
MKQIHVVAAIIKADNKIFATQRGYGEFQGMWEFPGGKIEANESKEAALIREIKEELDVDIQVDDWITRLEYDYPNFHLSMDCFFASIISGEMVLKEHMAAKWLGGDELDSVEWLPADIILIEQLKRML